MRLGDFEAMVRHMSAEVPPDFLDGVSEIVVSPRTLPHPERPEVFTLGECVPLPVQVGSGVEGVQSRIVLYHGSFSALAHQRPGFDWRHEAWETLSHELRHHLEWRARAPDLEDLDWAVEHNFARHDGEPFDPTFFLSGEVEPGGNYRVEDDVFIDRIVRSVPEAVAFEWNGQEYRAAVPPEAELPCFLLIEGVRHPPDGDLVLVLRRKPGVRDLFAPSTVYQATVRATP